MAQSFFSKIKVSGISCIKRLWFVGLGLSVVPGGVGCDFNQSQVAPNSDVELTTIAPNEALSESLLTARMRAAPIPEGTPFSPSDEATTLGPGVLVYQNNGHMGEFFAPGASVQMADDLLLTGTNRKLNRIRHVCVFSPGPGNYSVTMQLWTDDPNGCGPLSPIAGASCTVNNLAPGTIWDAAGSAPCDFSPATAPVLPNDVWMVLTFSTNQAGWVLAYVAEVGFTADMFHLNPPDNCTDYSNDYSGQCIEIHADPSPVGACCDDDGGLCTEGVTQASCQSAGNRYGGDGSNCATIQPPCTPPPTGACCTSSGGCMVTTQAGCNGAYLGNNTACSPVGACCIDRDNDGEDENCVQTPPVCCALASGSFSGPGSSCGGNGACCYDADGNGSTESCRSMSSTCCMGIAGTFNGVGSNCGALHGDIAPAPNGNGIVNLDDILRVLCGFGNPASCNNADIVPCGGNGVVNLDDILSELKAFSGIYDCPTACQGACCLSGDACQIEAQAQCSASGGVFQGHATSCGALPCVSDCNNNGIEDGEEVQGGGVMTFARAPNLSIPDNNSAGVSDAVFVGSAATVRDVEVELNIAHTSNRDLVVTLTHDNDAAVVLVSGLGRVICGLDAGYTDDGLNVTLDDEATNAIHFYQQIVVPVGPLTGTWRPDTHCGEVALSVFEGGGAAGTWTLRVADTSSGQTGTLLGWTLRIRTTPLTAPDCNHNGRPDACDVAQSDCNNNGIPDSCDGDCNGNGLADVCDIFGGTSSDINGNQVPDECDPDCNENGTPDDVDIAIFASPDCNGNATPDECDLAAHMSKDRQPDGIPDECQLGGKDCQPDLIPDNWQVASGVSPDCNGNNAPDECDILHGISGDFNNDGRPDECGSTSAEFQLFGFNPSSAVEGQLVQVFGSGFPSTNPLDYCISIANGRAGAEVIQVHPSSMLIRVEGNTDRGIGPIAIAHGFGGELDPSTDPAIITDFGRFFNGFNTGAQVGLFNVAPTDILSFGATFDPNLNGGSLCLPLKGDWKKNDKYYVHMHMKPNSTGQLWDYSEEISFTADDTGAQCADKIKKRFNDAATAAGCNCTATVNGTTIKVTCTGGASIGWGSATLKEWKREGIATAIGTLTVTRTSTGFTFTDDGNSTMIPSTTVTIGEKALEYGCMYATNLDGRHGLMKIVALTGSPTNDVKFAQTVKGTRKRKRAGQPDRDLLPALPAVVLDEGTGATPANPCSGPNWPLSHGRGFVDFTSGAAPSPPTTKNGDKIEYDESYETFIVCNNTVLGYLKWDFKGTFCVGANAAAGAWQNPQPATNKSWKPRDMTAGSEFKMAFDHLNGLVDNDFK